MQLDFTDGTGRHDDETGAELYSDRDLRYGILWAESYLAEGLTREPMKGYSLRAFGRWCREKLGEDGHVGELLNRKGSDRPSPTASARAFQGGSPVEREKASGDRQAAPRVRSGKDETDRVPKAISTRGSKARRRDQRR
jgi:hypothetical protein